MANITIGQYYPENSIIHQIRPTSKIIWHNGFYRYAFFT